jgi:CHASE2 domain-containing sensor protein
VRRWRVWAIEGAILIVAVALTWALPRHLAFTAIAENLAQDFRAGYFAEPEPTHPDIVVVAITEDTLAKFPYRFPVDRAFLADLLNTLNGIGVKAVGFDILFDQETEPEKDAALREALLNAKMPVIVGWTDRETGLTEAQAEFQQEYLQGIRAAYSNTLKDVSDSTIRRIFPGRNDEDGQFRPAFPAAIAAALDRKSVV